MQSDCFGTPPCNARRTSRSVVAMMASHGIRLPLSSDAGDGVAEHQSIETQGVQAASVFAVSYSRSALSARPLQVLSPGRLDGAPSIALSILCAPGRLPWR